MSGDDSVPVVNIFGPAMESLAQAIQPTEERTGRPVIVVGGLAVVCRLSHPYRATTDLDIVNRRTADERPQLELLLVSGARPSGPSGVLVPTPAGPVQVDVLEITDADLDPLPEDPTDRLHVLAHAWAAATASPVELRSSAIVNGVTTRVAEPGALIAMKLQSVMNRGRQKEATDLLDIIRLSLDPATGPSSRMALRDAGTLLRQDAHLHSRRWFAKQASRTFRLVQSVPEGREVTEDDIQFVADLLDSALTDQASR